LALAAVIAANEAVGLEVAIEMAAEKILDASSRPQLGKLLEPLHDALKEEKKNEVALAGGMRGLRSLSLGKLVRVLRQSRMLDGSESKRGA